MVFKARSNIDGAAGEPSSTARGDKSSPDVISFREALGLAHEPPKRHLMLGNGFSRAIRPKIFSYDSLLESARKSGRLTDEMAQAFKELETTDFEYVMKAYDGAAVLVSIYEGTNPQLAERLRAAASVLRDVLAETIAANHPARPYDIDRKQYAACRRFLANFKGSMYTLNYDLLLYWTLMQSDIPPELKSDDGFRHPKSQEQDYVVWEVQNSDHQKIFYLHGALHLYEGGAEILKYTWSKTEVPLVDQIRRALERREYPLIVTEGTREQKLSKIQRSGFLDRARRSFAKIGGSLFVYGHSFAENDEHLLKLIEGGRLEKLFVGLYDDVNQQGNQHIINRALLMKERREEKGGKKLEVHFFDAVSAHVWDDEGFDEEAAAKPRGSATKAVVGA